MRVHQHSVELLYRLNVASRHMLRLTNPMQILHHYRTLTKRLQARKTSAYYFDRARFDSEIIAYFWSILLIFHSKYFKRLQAKVPFFNQAPNLLTLDHFVIKCIAQTHNSFSILIYIAPNEISISVYYILLYTRTETV